MSKLSDYIGYSILRRKKKNVDRDKRVQNFELANSALIVFDASIPNCYEPIKSFAKFMKSFDIKTGVIGLVQQKEVPEEMLRWHNFKFLTKKNITFYGKPKGELAAHYFEMEPELLFVINYQRNITIEYLTQLSRAKFKVGCFSEMENDLDLMIKPLDDVCDTGFFLDQIKHYVKLLNPSK